MLEWAKLHSFVIYEKVMHPNILALARTILQKLVLLYVILNAYWYYCNAVNKYAPLFCSWISAIEKSKDSLDQLIQCLKTLPDVKWKLYEDFLHLQEGVHGLGFHPHHAMIHPIVQVHVVNSRQASGREDNDESWEENNFLPSPIPWFQAGLDLGAASWLVIRLESDCESACCKK